MAMGAPGMEEDYRSFLAFWNAGDRERDKALQLLFLAWMHWADPPFVTGMDADADAKRLWHDIFAHFGGEEATDAEFLHVASVMASIFPWELGDEIGWEAAAERMRQRAIKYRPEGFQPELFEGRGDYGEYFAHHARYVPVRH